MSFSSAALRQLISERESALRESGTVLFSQARYEIQRVLGEGGMGITCLAHEYSAGGLKRPVVLKFVKDSLAPQRLKQFLNEVQLSSLFNHPNILPIYRLESEVLTVELAKNQGGRRRPHEHTVYYAMMQYIDGWNLRQIVERLRNLKILLHHDMTMFIIGRIARGLHYVHEYCDDTGMHLGLVHRDISPENILIDRFGRIKVSDFGIARAMNAPAAEDLPHAGNPLYCSPEQLEGRALDRRSDIYNIGLLMYFLFTDTDRFRPESASSHPRERTRQKMKRSPLNDLGGVDPLCARMCDTCLRENADDRFQTCEDMANDIDIYFKERQRVPNNEQLEEILRDLFRPKPTFVSRRFIALTGSAVLEQPDFRPELISSDAEPIGHVPTVRLDEDE